jgi:hypothetical protein
MGHGKPARESIVTQIVVGVVVSVATTILSHTFGLEESASSTALTPSAAPSSSVRISYQLPEPEPVAAVTSLFDGRKVSADPVLGFVPEPQRLSLLP